MATRLRVSLVCSVRAPAVCGRDDFENDAAAAAKMRLGISRSFPEKEISFSTDLVCILLATTERVHGSIVTLGAWAIVPPVRKPETDDAAPPPIAER